MAVESVVLPSADFVYKNEGAGFSTSGRDLYSVKGNCGLRGRTKVVYSMNKPLTGVTERNSFVYFTNLNHSRTWAIHFTSQSF